MKKVFLIIGICLLIIGLGISITILAMVDFNIKELNNFKYTERSYAEDAAKVNKLLLDDTNRRVELKISNDEKIHIYYFESEKEFYKISLSDGVLSVISENNMKWYDYLGFKWDFNTSIRIEIPKNTIEDIKIETKNGDIIAENISVTDNIFIKTLNGRISSNEISCSSFKCESYNGKLLMDSISSENISCETKNGMIEIKNCVSQTLDAKVYNGAIELEAIDTQQADFKSYNGRIHGSMIGSLNEFSVRSSVKNGSCNLPSNTTNGEKSIVAETYNGSINISFTKD